MHFFEFKDDGLRVTINLEHVVYCTYDPDNNVTRVKTSDGTRFNVPGDALKSFRAILREKYTVHFGE